MTYNQIVVVIIHLLMYLPLYFLCKKKPISLFGFIVLIQLAGIVMLIHSIVVHDFFLAVRTPLTIILPFIGLIFMRNRPTFFKGKKYAGFQYYALLNDTNLKYVIGIFLLSLIIDLYFNPSLELLNYINLSSVGALLGSIFFCKNWDTD